MNGLKEIRGYAVAVVLSLLLLFPLLHLDQADLSVPFYHRGDALYYAAMIKGIVEHGWYFQNPDLGMPSGLLMYDALNSDNLHYLVLKGISFFTPDYAVVMNIYFLLTFPLTAVCALAVLRKFQLNYPIALLTALLYTFLPYHFYRGENHLFLSAYYLVPLAVLVVFRVLEDERLGIADFLICVLTASSVVYYGFFTCFFLALAGAARLIKTRRVKSLAKAAALIGCIIVVTLINLSPTILYQAHNGANPEAVIRHSQETETYGLKITHLLLPVPRHRIKALAGLNALYAANEPLRNENQFAVLGSIAAAGFLILIIRVFYLTFKKQETAPPWSTIDTLGTLNLGAVLLALTSGFGPLLGLIFPKFRGMNRMSIFIAFFSLLAVGLLLQKLYQRLALTKMKKNLFYAGLVLVLAWGLYDQTTPQMIPDYDWVKSRFTSDRDFIDQIEKQLPPHAMVFQLPYISFPEESFKGISPYGHFRAYLQSRTLRWSYGAMKGREGDAWQRRAVLSPLDQFLEMLALNGFRGIYLNRVGLRDYSQTGKIDQGTLNDLNRQGFPENGENLEQKLEEKLQCKPLVSSDQTLSFYNMEKYIATLEKKSPHSK